jgi:LPXTG-motif cell wall-anchored protein
MYRTWRRERPLRSSSSRALATELLAALVLLIVAASSQAAAGQPTVSPVTAPSGQPAATPGPEAATTSGTPAPPTPTSPAQGGAPPAQGGSPATTTPASAPAVAGRPQPQPTTATLPAFPKRAHASGHSSRRAPHAHAAAGSSITIKDFSFGPSASTVHVGDTVTWVNEGPANHTATAAGVFDTGVLHKGQSASHVFTRAGTFSYRCSIHPFMRATITVLPASGSTGTQSSGSGTEAGSTETPRGSTGAGSNGVAAGSSAPGAGSSSGAAAGNPSASVPTLPNTGMDTRAEILVGLGMLLLGIALLLGVARAKRR